MTFREKIHWAAFVSIALAFGWYFLTYPWGLADQRLGVGIAAGMLVPVTIIIVAAMVATAAISAIRSPKEASVREDERDQSFHIRATHWAYYPLVLGVYGCVVAQFWGVGPGWMLNLLLAVVVMAELIRVGVQLLYYRRGL